MSNTNFKFDLGQEIFYLLDNSIHSGDVLSRMIVENLHEDWNATKEQKELFNSFGKSGIYYATCHTIVKEENAFKSIRDLKNSL